MRSFLILVGTFLIAVAVSVVLGLLCGAAIGTKSMVPFVLYGASTWAFFMLFTGGIE